MTLLKYEEGRETLDKHIPNTPFPGKGPFKLF
jgi:hypothetical protein